MAGQPTSDSPDIPLISPCGVVLAGGSSSRMGRDKALLPSPNGGTWLDEALRKLRDLGDDEVFPLAVSAPASRNYPLPDRVGLLEDHPNRLGPLAGVERALEFALSHECQWVLTLPVDCPLVEEDWLASLLHLARRSARPQDVIYDAEQPLAAAWSIRVLPALRDYLDRGGRSVLGFLEASNNPPYMPGGQAGTPPDTTLANINSPADFSHLPPAWTAALNKHPRS
jgi:molybdopterin-guanine dinucleotide biosynthesis protein A